jgi:hypothetical protein
VDPQLYLTQLLINLPTLPISKLPQWLPDQWKINHTARPDCLQFSAGHVEESHESRPSISCSLHLFQIH